MVIIIYGNYRKQYYNLKVLVVNKFTIVIKRNH